MNKQIAIHKYAGLFMILLLIAPLAFAQDGKEKDEAKTDSTEIIFKNRRIIIITDGDGKKIEIKEVDGDAEGSEDVIVIQDEDDEEYDERYEDEDDYDWKEGRDDDDDDDDDDYDYEHKQKKSNKTSDVNLLGLDLGFTNYYSNGQYGLAAVPSNMAIHEFRPGSHVALHFFPTTASLLGNGAVNLKTALTLDWTQLYFSSNVQVQDNGEVTTFNQQASRDLIKNKLTARYVQVPLLLNINTDPWGKDGLSLSFGVYGGILWKGWTKQVYAENGQKVVDKVDGSYNMSPIRYGLMARVDFKWFDIYGMYNLVPLFENGAGPETQTVMFGVNVINF